MFDKAPLVIIVLLLFCGMLAAFEGGLRLHRRLGRMGGVAAESSSDESYVLSGVFGLLALLMAFAFSLALDRHEQRRVLVVEEANAIGTFSSRLTLLPPAEQAPIRDLLARYASHRSAAGRSAKLAEYDKLAADAEALHSRMGARLYAALGTGPGDTRTPLLVQPFNEMGDIATSCHAVRATRLPGEVMLLLAVYCIIGTATLGYTLSGAGNLHRLASGVFFLLLALAFTTIVDLDRARDGFIQVPQEALMQVARQLKR